MRKTAHRENAERPRRTFHFGWLLALAATGCGGGASYSTGDASGTEETGGEEATTEGRSEDALEESANLELRVGEVVSDLDQTLANPSPDCPRACDLTATICRISERVCDLAGENVEPEIATRCEATAASCESARLRTASHCEPCP